MSKSIKIDSSSKLNLCLDIINKSPSGYHEIRSIFKEHKKLRDTLKVKATPRNSNTSTLETHHKNDQLLKLDPLNNTIIQTIKLVQKELKITENFHVELEKNIPISAGLGGGSSNAAATLKAIIHLLKLKVPIQKQIQLLSQISKDAPFFLFGKTALVEGFGEKITPLPDLEIELNVLPIKEWPAHPKKTKKNKKTKSIYQKIDLAKCNSKQEKTKELLQLIKEKNATEVAPYLHSDFEQLYLLRMPKNAHLTGSGNAVFQVRPS